MLGNPFKWLARLFNLVGLIIFLSFFVGGSLVVISGFAIWYKNKNRDAAQNWGLIWTAEADGQFNLSTADLDQILTEMPFQRVQLITPWSTMEPSNNLYNFDLLDAQIAVAQKHNVSISLQIGLHQTGQTCYLPPWAANLSYEDMTKELSTFIVKILQTLKNYHHIQEYQLEPEIFSSLAEDCPHKLTRTTLTSLFSEVQQQTSKKIALSQAHNRPRWSKNSPTGDLMGLTIRPNQQHARWYQNALTLNPPPSYYTFLAGNLEALNKNSRVFIRQAHWLGDDWQPSQSLGADQSLLQSRLEYTRQTAVKTIDLARVEYCYFLHLRGHSICWQTLRDFLLSNS